MAAKLLGCIDHREPEYEHWRELPQICLSRQNFCHDKHVFDVTNICHDKHNFVELTFVMKIRVCHDKTRLFIKSNFVVTKVLSQQAYFCRDKNDTCGSSHQ